MRTQSCTISNRELLRIRQLAADARESRWREGFDPCVYCGVIANSVDHVPPRAIRERLVALGLALRYPFVEVPACRECNSVLGARAGWTVSDRRRYVKQALKRRYASVLRIPDWSDTELAQMSPGMQSYIADGLQVRDFIRQRLAFAVACATAAA